MANVETVEGAFPVRYLFRRRAIDSGGPGRHRGGTGGEMALVPHKAPDGGIDYVISGKGARHPMSEGLAGGWPGAPNAYVWVHAPEGAAVPVTGAEAFARAMPGRRERVSWGVYPLKGRDALYVRWNGGGGWGDPLDRDPEAVARRCRGPRQPRGGADVYGVALTTPTAPDRPRPKALRARSAARACSGGGGMSRRSRRPAPSAAARWRRHGACAACGHALAQPGQRRGRRMRCCARFRCRGVGGPAWDTGSRRRVPAPVLLPGLRAAPRHRDGDGGRPVPDDRLVRG
jgi:hypothetical protein